MRFNEHLVAQKNPKERVAHTHRQRHTHTRTLVCRPMAQWALKVS